MIDRDEVNLAWRDGDIAMVSATALLGLIAIVAAGAGAAGSATLAHQVAWLNLAVAGFAVSAGGNCMWLLRGRRAVGRRRLTLIALRPTHRELHADAPGQAGIRAASQSSTASFEVVRGVGMARVHTRHCPLVAGKRVEPADLDDGARCEVCMP